MVTDVQAEVPGHAEEVFETLECASKKIAPLYTLALRHSLGRKVDHLPNIRVVPAAKRDAGNEVLVVYEAEGLELEQVVVVSTEGIESNSRLAEGVYAVHRANAPFRPH